MFVVHVSVHQPAVLQMPERHPASAVQRSPIPFGAGGALHDDAHLSSTQVLMARTPFTPLGWLAAHACTHVVSEHAVMQSSRSEHSVSPLQAAATAQHFDSAQVPQALSLNSKPPHFSPDAASGGGPASDFAGGLASVSVSVAVKGAGSEEGVGPEAAEQATANDDARTRA